MNFIDFAPRTVECSAIWLHTPVTLPYGARISRITEGHEVYAERFKVADSFGMATHRILGCFALVSNGIPIVGSEHFLALNLITNEPEIIYP